MAGMDMFHSTPWRSGFVQYADPIPPGPHVYGPPPYGVWPTSVRRPVQSRNGAPIAPSDIAEAAAEDQLREDDRLKALFIEKKRVGQAQLVPVQPTPPVPSPSGTDIAAALLPKPPDKTMIWAGAGIAAVGLATRIFAGEKTTAQTLASAAAIVGGIGLVYKGLQR